MFELLLSTPKHMPTCFVLSCQALCVCVCACGLLWAWPCVLADVFVQKTV